jgi:hypothetical protein
MDIVDLHMDLMMGSTSLYSEKDYQVAEKKFLKFALLGKINNLKI